MQSGLLLLWVVTLTSAEFFVNFDQKLEDRPRVYKIVKEEVGRLDIPAKHNVNDNDGKVPPGSELTARQAIDVLLGKRQSCSQGYYWYYYWTYSIDIQASIVTSSRSSTWTTFSVKTTDASAASEYFSSKSKTLSLPTPAAATSLESLAGSTSFVSPPPSDSPSASPSPTDKPSFSMPPQPTISPFVPVDGTDGTSKSKSSSSTTTTMLRSGGNDNGGSKGDGSSGAAPLWAGSDCKTAWILVLGAGTGLLAVIL
ncbi:hypothetical protein TgHK011_001299 [Trichoderma gracile]|nr:hypothetical protein TgHK011_001299 [Trichoderma gracile]